MLRSMTSPPTPPSLGEAFDPETVLAQLTTEEKIDLLSGNSYHLIPKI
jgi:hypothetical protein